MSYLDTFDYISTVWNPLMFTLFKSASGNLINTQETLLLPVLLFLVQLLAIILNNTP